MPPVLLVDDLAAELDDMMRAQAVDMFLSSGGQSFFTAIHPRMLPEIAERAAPPFHVEQHSDRQAL
jgi:recombinational DNA repair ATPase RecF